jgi:hypothetical protein
MTFELVRAGWPNIAAIIALAISPMIALTAAPGQRLETMQVQQVEPATMCQAPAPCGILASAAADAGLE